MASSSTPESVPRELPVGDVTEYHRNGYLVTSSLLTPDEKRIVIDAVTDVGSLPTCPGKWMHYFEPHALTGEKILCRTENFVPYSAVFGYWRKPQSADPDPGTRPEIGRKILSALHQLLGEPVTLYKDKINYKQPGGNGFLPHQDAGAFQSVGVKNHITVLIAIDAATIENGCLEMAVDCSDIWERKTPLKHDNQGGILDEVVETLDWKPLPMLPGDVLFFGSYIPHRSGPNWTTLPRRALYFTYNPAKEGDKYEQYYLDKRQHFPPDCERQKGKDYSDGAKVYNLGNPIRHFD